MKTFNQVKEASRQDVRQMLYSIYTEYGFLTPESRKKLLIGIGMVLREAKIMADSEQAEIMAVLESEIVQNGS